MIRPCDKCGYDWEKNDLRIVVRIDAKNVAPVVPFHCPVCGSERKLRVYDLGDEEAAASDEDSLGAVKLSDGRVVQWKDTADANPGIKLEGAISLGVEDVIYPAIPVFSDAKGDPTVPHLPVRMDYLELVDLGRFRKNFKEWRGKLDLQRARYTAQIPFRGRRDEASRPVERAFVGKTGRTTVNPREEAIKGFDLSVWPRVTSDVWKTFLVESSCPAAGMIGSTGLECNVAVQAPADSKPERSEVINRHPGWFKLGPVEFKGFPRKDPTAKDTDRRVRSVAVVNGRRPSAVATCVGSFTEPVAGGVFLPAAPQGTIKSGGTLRLGLDFGTSNTCIALDAEGLFDKPGPDVLPVGNLAEPLVQWGDGEKLILASQYTPRFASRFFGPKYEFFPTEIMACRPALEASADDQAVIRSWIPGVDIAVPGNDVDWKEHDPGTYVIDNLKWEEGTGTTAGWANRPQLVASYLKTVFVQTMAAYFAVAESKHLGVCSDVTVDFGYPGKWGDAQKRSLRENLKEAVGVTGDNANRRWGLGDWVSFASPPDVKDGLDEASAASRVVDKVSPEKLGPVFSRNRFYLDVIIDVGGGSTDIAITWKPAITGGKTIIENLVSLRYAGQDLFRALWGPDGEAGRSYRCFSSSLTKADVHRMIRTVGPAEELFDPIKKVSRDKRVSVFYEQIIEYIARLIVANYANGQYKRRNYGQADFLVNLYRLGNGWGMVRMAHDVPDQYCQAQLEHRIDELIAILADQGHVKKEDFEGDRLPRVTVQSATVQGMHPKKAVAIGLLKPSASLSEVCQASASELNRSIRGGTPPTGDYCDCGAVGTWHVRSIVGMPVRMVVHSPTGSEERWIRWWDPVESTTHYFEHVQGVKLLGGAGYAATLEDVQENPQHGVPFPKTIEVNGRQSLARALERLPLVRAMDTGNEWFTMSPLSLLLEEGLRERLETLT